MYPYTYISFQNTNTNANNKITKSEENTDYCYNLDISTFPK